MKVRYIHRPANDWYPETTFVIGDMETIVKIARVARERCPGSVWAGRHGNKRYRCQIQAPRAEVLDIVRRAREIERNINQTV